MQKIDTPNGWDVEGDVARAHDVSTSISISQLLRSVEEVFDDTLSEDVYEHFGVNRRKSDFSEGLRYALPGKNKLATKYLKLAKAPEKNDIKYALADNSKRSCLLPREFFRFFGKKHIFRSVCPLSHSGGFGFRGRIFGFLCKIDTKKHSSFTRHFD